MDTATNLAFGAAGAALGTAVAYLDVVTVAARVANRRSRPRPEAAAPMRFAVLIPAHDEERLIAATLDALAAVDYPADSFRVHVVADNCTDATVAIARSRGVEVHERVAPADGGKGPALQWALERLWQREDRHDAVVVLDADTVVHRGVLRALAAELDAGASVVQGYYTVREPASSATAAFRTAALAARHYLRPLGRTAVGGSSGLFGNGMAFRDEILRSRTWSRHLTEDNELQLDLLLEGTKVRFAPGAVLEAEMPATLEASVSQNERWERGRLDLARRYVPALAARALRGGPAGRVAYLDATLDQLTPPFSVLVAATAAYGAGATLWFATARSRGAGAHVGLAAALVAGEAAHVLAALRMVGAPPAVYRSLAGAPKQILWKTRLWARMLRPGREVAWVRTERNVDSSADAATSQGGHQDE